MANVSSWADIVDAVTNTTTDITLSLTKDIDLAEEPDYVFGITPLALNGYNLTLNGNGHQIINLTNDLSTSGGIFIADANSICEIEIQNVDFVNLVLNNAALVQSLNAENELEVTNCGFEGKRNGTSFLFDVPQAKFVSCYFEMPWLGANQTPAKYTSLVTSPTSGTNPTNYKAEYCWFREHYTNWTYSSSYQWNYYQYQHGRGMLWSFFFIMLDGCYIDGDMTLADSASSVPVDMQHHANRSAYTPTKMSVFDVDVVTNGAHTSAKFGSWYGLYVNKVYNSNNTLITTWSAAPDTSAATSAYAVPIIGTEAQASSVTWLQENGFDI